MKRLLLCVCSVLIFSCSKSDVFENLGVQSETNFYALNVGNSWVYKSYQRNPMTGEYDDTGIIDSVSVIGTEVIDGESYYKFRRLTTGNDSGLTFYNPNGEYFEFLRESDGNLVDEDGNIRFTNNNYEERLLNQEVWGDVYEVLIEGVSTLTVEAGVFDCIYSERYAINPDGDRYNGTDRFYYSKGIGRIYDTFSFISNSSPFIIRRLDSYDVQ